MFYTIDFITFSMRAERQEHTLYTVHATHGQLARVAAAAFL